MCWGKMWPVSSSKIGGVIYSKSACQEVLVYSFRVLKCSGSIIRINEIFSFNYSDNIVLTCLENSGWPLCGSVGTVTVAEASPLVCFIQG